MKYFKPLFLFSCILLIVFSCSNYSVNEKNSNESTLKEKVENVKKIGKVEFNFEGKWILKSYLDNIEKKRSIYLNKNPIHSILGFSYNSNDESLIHGYLIHEEGYDFPVKKEKLNNKDIILVEDMSRKNLISIPNNGFSLFPISKDEIQWQYKDSISKYNYVRTHNDIDYELRKILFAGEYLNNSGQKITFLSDGTVLNFKDFSHFNIIYDFGLGIDFDAIVMFNKKIGNWSDGIIFKYKFNGSKLILNKIDSDWETLEHHETSQIIELTLKGK